MSFFIEYRPAVVHDDIPKLDQVIRLRIKKTIETKLLTYPDIFGIPLRHPQAGYRKLRVGNYRVIFQIVTSTSKVIIYAIQHRSIVYQTLAKRSS